MISVKPGEQKGPQEMKKNKDFFFVDSILQRNKFISAIRSSPVALGF